MKFFAEQLQKHKGTKVVIICAKYQYWGIIADCNPDTLELAQAVAVEVSGSAQSSAAETIDNIGTSIIIALGAIEICYWPKWVNNKLPSE